MTTSFTPVFVGDRWLCPCHDSYGEASALRRQVFANDRIGANEVMNYLCEQNFDRWQQICAPNGGVTWIYLGRRGGSL